MSRFALLPVAALSDYRLRCAHIRLLLVLNVSPTDANGWCWCSLEELGKAAGTPRPDGTVAPMPPDEVARALGELQEWGYVEAYTGRDGSRAYRMLLDLPPDFSPLNR